MKTADELKKEAEEIMLREKARIRRFYWDLIELHLDSEEAPVKMINNGYIEIPEEDVKEFLEGIREEYTDKGLTEESCDKIIEAALKTLENELDGMGWKLIAKGIAPLDYKKENSNKQIVIPRLN